MLLRGLKVLLIIGGAAVCLDTTDIAAQPRTVSEPRRQSEPILLDPQPVDHWQKQLSSADWLDRWEAVYAIATIGADAESAIPALIELLRDKDERVQAGAAHALSRLGLKSFDAMLKLLRTGDRRQRRWAVYALGRTGNEAAIEPVILALTDSREEVREKAADSLKMLGFINPTVVRAFSAVLKDTNPGVRFHATVALGHSRDPAVAPLLIPLLNDDNKNVRAAACEAIGRIGDPSGRSVPKLIERLDDDDYVKAFAIVALGAIGHTAAEDSLQPIATQSKNTRLSNKAKWALSHIAGSAAKGAVP